MLPKNLLHQTTTNIYTCIYIYMYISFAMEGDLSKTPVGSIDVKPSNECSTAKPVTMYYLA